MNTLYVDENLRYHGLIQAFSRTNRVLGAEKSHGNIVCFRDLKERTDEAIALFADKNAREVVLMGTYEEHLARLDAAVVVPRPSPRRRTTSAACPTRRPRPPSSAPSAT